MPVVFGIDGFHDVQLGDAGIAQQLPDNSHDFRMGVVGLDLRQSVDLLHLLAAGHVHLDRRPVAMLEHIGDAADLVQG